MLTPNKHQWWVIASVHVCHAVNRQIYKGRVGDWAHNSCNYVEYLTFNGVISSLLVISQVNMTFGQLWIEQSDSTKKHRTKDNIQNGPA